MLKKINLKKGLYFIILFSNIIYAQSILVTGKVVDKQGQPLPGVTIQIEGTSSGTSTTFEGNYALKANDKNDVLKFSYIGFESQNIIISDQSIVNIIMQENLESLDEVQVVAFQKQKKNSVIGSINTINPSELKIPSSNLTNSLAGRMAGMISYQTSGEPGADNAQFFIRGVTSFGYANNPLILIDGLEVSTDDLARMEPDNIASFSIMKDATATALYGARGANGVILVTTKEGKKGKARVSFRYENSFSAPTQTNEFLGGVEYMNMYNQATRSRDPSAPLLYSINKIFGTTNSQDPNIYPNVNWYDELFKDYTLNRKANLNVNGGGDIAQYYLSISHNNDTGLLKVDPLNNFNNNIDINRSNLRANININVSETTKIAVKFYSLFERYNGPSSSANDIFGNVMQANPVNFPKYYQFENNLGYNHTLFGNKGNGGFPNPYADMVKGYKDRFTNTILSQVQLQQDLGFITEGLKFRGMASVRTYAENENSRNYNPFYYGMAEIETEEGLLNYLYQIQEGTEYLNSPSINNYSNSNFYYEFTTEYNRIFEEKHEVGGLLVFNFSESLNTISGSSDFASLPSRNMGVSGRFSYNYDARYFTEFNFGYNGSEKFAEDNRYGFFPSVGFGWIVSNEKWFEDMSSSINLLKLKFTHGKVGNDGISSANDRFFYLSDVNLNDGGTGYSWGLDYGNYSNGYLIYRYSNPNVTWEVAEKTNFGLELEINKALNLQVDYFKEHRTQIYMQRDYIPESMGLTTGISSNLGEVKSKGVDASLDYNQAFSSGLYLSGRANFTYATNEVLVNGEPNYEFDNLSGIGHPVNQPFGLIAERLFIDAEDIANSPEQFNGFSSSGNAYLPGDIKYTDLNGDGVVNENDRTAIGSPQVPEIIYGFGISAGYRDFDLSIFMQGAAKVSFFINPNDISPFVNERNALSVIADNYWSENNPNPNAFWPRLSTYEISNNQQQSTWWQRNGDFLRLKNVEFGYTLPEKSTGIFSGLNTRIYFTGLNLLTFSKFDLWDTEMGGNGLGYPPQKIYNLGLQVKF
ncbi:MAG: SusC/RagA family TonB-linked outer membrane protein [Flavobacteriales bacterium]|jgi:TonB-linked SusC/RagA family outer membrane protein